MDVCTREISNYFQLLPPKLTEMVGLRNHRPPMVDAFDACLACQSRINKVVPTHLAAADACYDGSGSSCRFWGWSLEELYTSPNTGFGGIQKCYQIHLGMLWKYSNTRTKLRPFWVKEADHWHDVSTQKYYLYFSTRLPCSEGGGWFTTYIPWGRGSCRCRCPWTSNVIIYQEDRIVTSVNHAGFQSTYINKLRVTKNNFARENFRKYYEFVDITEPEYYTAAVSTTATVLLSSSNLVGEFTSQNLYKRLTQLHTIVITLTVHIGQPDPIGQWLALSPLSRW